MLLCCLTNMNFDNAYYICLPKHDTSIYIADMASFYHVFKNPSHIY